MPTPWVHLETCGTCRFFQPPEPAGEGEMSVGDGKGHCNRFPPEQPRKGDREYWRTTFAEHTRCGEWKQIGDEPAPPSAPIEQAVEFDVNGSDDVLAVLPSRVQYVRELTPTTTRLRIDNESTVVTEAYAAVLTKLGMTTAP